MMSFYVYLGQSFLISTSFREHFAEEVEKVWHCHHEHIQPLLEYGAGDDLLYSATLVSDAETLEQYVKRQPEQVLPVHLVVNFASQLCAALHCAHEQGIVHGNIQPSSILVHDRGHLLLTHFSMRRVYQKGEPLVAQINEGNAAYSAPEQALGMLLPASDVYAMGVLLFRLLSGTLPYVGEDAEETTLKHANEPIPSLRSLRPDMPESLELVVRRALAKKPEARFAHMAALAQALQAAIQPIQPANQFIIPSEAERRIAVHSHRTRFSWSRAASFLTLSMLLFSLLGASIFVISQPQHIFNVPGLSFLNVGQVGPAKPVGPIGKSNNKSGHGTATPGATPAIVPGTAMTPVTGVQAPSPTVKATQPLPILHSTVVATPTDTPTKSPFDCASGTLSMDGSQNLKPLIQQASSDYQQLCPGIAISLSGSSSRYALNALQQNRIDVAALDLSARPQRALNDHPVAAMLYAIILSPDVQIGALSSASIQDIYQGRITNWSEVGGPDEPITVFQRPGNDAVTAIFRAFVLNGASEHVKGIRLKQDWAQAVAQTPGAISYVSLTEAQSATVDITGINGVLPALQTLSDGSYPFWSVEHLYTRGNGSAQFQAYLPFLVSEQEAPMFVQYGAVPVTMLSQSVLATHLPGPQV